MEQEYKHCQSCSMPMKKDPDGGGTNANNTTSKMYCSTCYQNGKFTSPEIDTPKKMQALVKEKIMSGGFPGFMASLFTRNIPTLKR